MTNDCIIFYGKKTKDGYGKVCINGKDILSHRAAFLLYKGIIPKNMCVCHSCDNPACINPEHLWLGTHKDNMLDKANKGRAPKNTEHWSNKLSISQVLDIREKFNRKELSTKEIADQYCITLQHVRSIGNRKKWRHLNAANIC